MSTETAVEQVGRRVELHREAHRAWRRVALGLLVVAMVLAAAIVLLVLRERPVDRFYATTPDGRVIPFTPLEEPVMTQAALGSWVVTAVTEAFTVGHHDWRLRLSGVREYFTEDGYEGYTRQLEESRLLERVREYRQVTSAVAKGAPVMTKATMWQGRALWTMEFPMLLTFHVGNREDTIEFVVTTLVMRVRREERPAGIGIQQIVMERRS